MALARQALLQEPGHLSMGLLLGLDQTVRQSQKGEGTPESRKQMAAAAKEARELLVDASQLYDLSPVCREILQAANKFGDQGNLNTKLELLRKAVAFSGSPVSPALRRLLGETLAEKAINSVRSLLGDGKDGGKLEQAHLPLLTTALTQLEEASRLKPKDPTIESALTKAQRFVAELGAAGNDGKGAGSAPKAKGNWSGEPLALPSPEAALLKSFSGKKQKSKTYLLTLLLAVCLVGVVLFKYEAIRPQKILSLVTGEVAMGEGGPVAVEATADGESQSSGVGNAASGAASSPGADSGQMPGGSTVGGGVDMEIPAPRDGLTSEEALARIEDLGVKVPEGGGGAGSGSTGPADASPGMASAGGASTATDGAPEIPAPRDGISTEEALARIDEMGVKVPGEGGAGGSSSGASAAGDAAASVSGVGASGSDSGIPAPRDGMSTDEALARVDEMGVKTPGVATGDGGGSAGAGASVFSSTSAGASATLSAGAAGSALVAESASGGERGVSRSGSTGGVVYQTRALSAQEAAARQQKWTPLIDSAVRIHLDTETFQQLYLKSIDGESVRAIRTPDDYLPPMEIPLSAITTIEPLADPLVLYVDRRVRVKLKQGFTKKGILRNTDPEMLYLEKKIFGGFLQFEIERENVEDVRLAS
ncbi:MAG: hypothetical protein HQL52_01625 [Magnetococcales bacterium]|nr:hypothetical protein [Magnetococcales bacterium]